MLKIVSSLVLLVLSALVSHAQFIEYSWQYSATLSEVVGLTANIGETSVEFDWEGTPGIREPVTDVVPISNMLKPIRRSLSSYPATPWDGEVHDGGGLQANRTYYFTVFRIVVNWNQTMIAYPPGTPRPPIVVHYSSGVRIACTTKSIVNAPSAPVHVKPSGVLPVKGSQQPFFEWQPQGDPSPWFRVYVTRNGSPYLSKWMQTRSWEPEDELSPGEYRWWVMGWNRMGEGPWSSGMSFTIRSLVPDVPTLLSPASGTRLYAGDSQTFEWEAADGATWYHIWINRNRQQHGNTWTQDTSYTPTVALSGGNYEWWVRSCNAHGISPWSTSSTFRYLVPDASSVSQPVAGDQYVVRRPPFVATAAAEASWYMFLIYKDGAFYTEEWAPHSTRTWTPDTDLPTGNYQVWVRTWNASGFGGWSSGVFFRVHP